MQGLVRSTPHLASFTAVYKRRYYGWGSSSTPPTGSSSVLNFLVSNSSPNSACLQREYYRLLHLRRKIPSKSTIIYPRTTNKNIAVAWLANLCVLSLGKPSGRSKQKSSVQKSVLPCHGLRGSPTQRNPMRSPGDSGGLQISHVYREEELVYRRGVISRWKRLMAESECLLNGTSDVIALLTQESLDFRWMDSPESRVLFFTEHWLSTPGPG